jgi:hypothetical protein
MLIELDSRATYLQSLQEPEVIGSDLLIGPTQKEHKSRRLILASVAQSQRPFQPF